MKYRHARHAGNFADVHKHVALLALIEALQRKPKGLLYLDTHAGRGHYELAGDAHEAGSGVLRLLAAQAAAGTPGEVASYLAAVLAYRREPGRAHAYPGSPELALSRLRDVDRALLVEAQHEEFLALRRALEHRRRVQLRHGDGYAALQSELPPLERRALVLIDPPYESGEERSRLLAALRAALARFATGVYVIWYPIKLAAEADSLRLALAATARERPVLYSELYAYAPDSRIGLNGSGLAIVNPPWQIGERMRAWLPPLAQRLAADVPAGRRAGEGAARCRILHSPEPGDPDSRR